MGAIISLLVRYSKFIIIGVCLFVYGYSFYGAFKIILNAVKNISENPYLIATISLFIIYLVHLVLVWLYLRIIKEDTFLHTTIKASVINTLFVGLVVFSIIKLEKTTIETPSFKLTNTGIIYICFPKKSTVEVDDFKSKLSEKKLAHFESQLYVLILAITIVVVSTIVLAYILLKNKDRINFKSIFT